FHYHAQTSHRGPKNALEMISASHFTSRFCRDPPKVDNAACWGQLPRWWWPERGEPDHHRRAERGTPTLAPFRPAFRKGQGAGAKRTTLALARPRLATRLSAVDRQPSPKGRHENGAHPVASLRRVMGLGMHQQWRTDVIPGERDVLRAGLVVFGPVVPAGPA